MGNIPNVLIGISDAVFLDLLIPRFQLGFLRRGHLEGFGLIRCLSIFRSSADLCRGLNRNSSHLPHPTGVLLVTGNDETVGTFLGVKRLAIFPIDDQHKIVGHVRIDLGQREDDPVAIRCLY